MPADIRPFGSTEGVGYYWVKAESSMGQGHLVLVAIDQLGELTETDVKGMFDEAAPTRGEAVLEHLGGAVAEADAKLERRRANAPDPPPEQPKLDRATRRWLEDG